MKKNTHLSLLVGLLIAGSLMSSRIQAEVIDGTHWLIKPGDSLYKIARNLYPKDVKKRERLRKELVSQNPQVFKHGNSQISVGDKLVLPEFAITLEDANPEPEKKHTPPVTSQPEQITQAPAPITDKITVDPEEIIGKVIINVGSLSAQNRGSTRTLNRRSPIYKGDTLTTGGRSLTQIRLKDGALLSLRPYTEIKIEEYNYNGREDGSEKSVLELLKGGFRTITGLIGHKNKQNYQIRTSVATIGIRGTHYSLVLCQQASCNDGDTQVDDGLYGGVADGSIVIENQSGIHRFNNDQYFKLTSASAAPVEFLLPPGVLKNSKGKLTNSGKTRSSTNKQEVSKRTKSAPRRLAVIVEPGQPDFSRRPKVALPDLSKPPLVEDTITTAPNGSGMLISFNETDGLGLPNGVAAGVIIAPKNNNAIVLGPNRVPVAAREVSYDIELDQLRVNELILGTADSGLAKLAPSSLGGDPKLGVNWGRWNGQFTVLNDGVKSQTQDNLHFIYSENLTSPAQLANLGQTIGSATYYSVDGFGTLPTDLKNNIADTPALIDLTVDFNQQSLTQYNVSAIVAGINYFASTSFSVPLNEIASGFSLSDISSGNTGQASVLFVGDQAQGAITAFQIQDAQSTNAITGTALLTPSGTIQETTIPVQ